MSTSLTFYSILLFGVSIVGAYGQTQDQKDQNPAPPPSQEQAPPRPSDRQTPPSPADEKAKAEKSAGAPVDLKTYKIGAGDILHVQVWRENDFTGPVAVSTDGDIKLPLVGTLHVVDKTPAAVETELTAALSKLIVKPIVTVTVQQVVSKKYYLDGEFNRTGEYQLTVPTTVLEAISIAGGFREFANKKKVKILRGSKRINFNYKDVIQGKNMDQNILLEPGDHVIAQ